MISRGKPSFPMKNTDGIHTTGSSWQVKGMFLTITFLFQTLGNSVRAVITGLKIGTGCRLQPAIL